MCSPATRSKSQDGFTLIEILIAIALLGIIASMVFGSLMTTNRAVEVGRDASFREQTIRRVLRVMAEDLSLSRQDGALPWVGANGWQEGQPADIVAFLAMNDGSSGPAARETELIRVVYTREGDRLLRFAKKNLYGLTDESIDRVELANHVRSFNLRYFDAQSRVWLDEWGGLNKLPKAVLIELTVQPPDTDPWTVREWVTLEAAS
ncbi:MAG: prepilin-type N-terminal cleavage/methylation domain-containing protein [Nitrospira sp.]|nr:prepilin-type N-terminal cleavage/methylation domain-containing protein [Nitrospira sp.]